MIRWMSLALTMLGCLLAPTLAQPDGGKTDDQAAKFPTPPRGFDARRDGIDRGKLCVGPQRIALARAPAGDQGVTPCG